MGGRCQPRGAGSLCTSAGQCAAPELGVAPVCGAAVSRCGTLVNGGILIPGVTTPDAPGVFRQCRANSYSSTLDRCRAVPTTTATTAEFCASGALVAGRCAESGPGGVCGATADCAGAFQCLVEGRRCVDPSNAIIGTNADACASGRLEGTRCALGERGESCVLATTPPVNVTGTCKEGLVCLDRVCR